MRALLGLTLLAAAGAVPSALERRQASNTSSSNSSNGSAPTTFFENTPTRSAAMTPITPPATRPISRTAVAESSSSTSTRTTITIIVDRASSTAATTTSTMRLSTDEQIRRGAGVFDSPAEGGSWTTVTNTNWARWAPFDIGVDVWLTNGDRGLLPEDTRLASVPPGTRVLMTSLPEHIQAGSHYTLYLTPTGNTTVLSRSSEFTISTLVNKLFNAAPRTESGWYLVAGAVAGALLAS